MEHKELKKYLDYLDKNPNGSETGYRKDFQYFIEEFTKNQTNIKVYIKHEPKKSEVNVEVEGTPDFFVYLKNESNRESFIGFIECKEPGTDLDKLIEKEQIKKYRKTTDNIILTNYKRFILLQKNNGHDVELSNDQHSITKFRNLLHDFYQYNYPYIKTKKVLVSELATQSFYFSVELREFIKNEENKEERFYKKFEALFKEYKTSINYNYKIEDFCDIYSQSFVYGLMLARLDTGKELDEERLNYLEDIPAEYELLNEFLMQGYDSKYLPNFLKPSLIAIGKNINMIDIEAIQKEFAKTGEGKQHIAVFLYEDFLQRYDNLKGNESEDRKENGVYYTPVEATNFITRSVNEILKTRFNKKQGYLSDGVKVLDFACGTGTFLHSVFEEMLKETKNELGKKNIIIPKIENDIYGFELLYVPYIIAHTMLTRFLKGKGITLKNRLGIYLANTLDIKQGAISEQLPAMKEEYEKAMKIKEDEPILAIIGNPPYSIKKSPAITIKLDEKLKDYKKDLGETKINLDDLYIKFIRFAEWKIGEQEPENKQKRKPEQKRKQGIIGIITNNSYLDGVTHRHMRRHLYETFDEIYILNLHGNTRKGEIDKNIFDIMVSVAIVFFVKLENPTKEKTVKYFSTFNNNLRTRSQKLDFLENTKFEKIKWKTLKPSEPDYWFVKKDFSTKSKNEYKNFLNIKSIFENYNSGIETQKDPVAIHYNKPNLDKVIKDFITLSEQDIATKYKIEDGRDWKISYVKKDLIANKGKDFYSQLSYRPFDNRITYITGKTKSLCAYPRYDIMRHFEKENIGLCFSRQVSGTMWQDFFITKKPIDCHVLSGKNYLAPLYIYKEEKEKKGKVKNGEMFEKPKQESGKEVNFTDSFKEFLKTLPYKTTPEKILYYIYAVLHSPIYRKKYVEFLKTDFPAVPFTKDKPTFEKYAKLGERLKRLHLLEDIPADKTIKVNGKIPEIFIINKIVHENNTLYLHTTKNERIEVKGITKEIYDFEIGSYSPIDKWLKYRKDDKVSLNTNDLQHIINMATAIKQTISIMKEIENLGEEYLK